MCIALSIHNPSKPLLLIIVLTQVTQDNFRPGLRIERGPDWKWDSQDGGPGGAGIIVKESSKGWATVSLESGKCGCH